MAAADVMLTFESAPDVWTMWDGRHAGKCINMSAQTYVCAALNIVMDVTIFLIPIPKL